MAERPIPTTSRKNARFPEGDDTLVSMEEVRFDDSAYTCTARALANTRLAHCSVDTPPGKTPAGRRTH